jgi:hypothetical protein
MGIGLLLIGVAAALGACESMWLAAANPRSRLPFLGWAPKNRPFGALVLQVMIVPTLVWGTRLLQKEGSHPSALWYFPCLLVVMVAIWVPSVIHNRKVAHVA